MARSRNKVVDVVVPRPEPSAPDFVKVEKNLNTLGFFTPAKHKGVKVREKIVTYRREFEGKLIEAQATILPSAKYGLPTAADLDKYLAFHRIVDEIRMQEGEVRKPVGFTSAQMMSILGMANSGNNYQEIHDWLQRMTTTTISSKGVIYMAKRKTWMSDTFHVFDRVVTSGSTLPDGTIADRHYVWLSDWQLENINSNYLLPIDIDTYRKLRNQIAKVLVPLLQVWLYATRATGRFEKRYSDLCQILDITDRKHLSLIRRQLEPSLTELTDHGYLASWCIDPTADGREYKLVATHGQKFYADQKIRATTPPPLLDNGEVSMIKEMAARGISNSFARRLLRHAPPDQPVLDQLEWGDHLILNARPAISNPPGFYVYLIKQNIQPPASFETTTKRRQREYRDNQRAVEDCLRLNNEVAYHEFCNEQIDTALAGLPPETLADRVAKHKREIRKQWGYLPPSTIAQIAEQKVRNDLKVELHLPTLEEFLKRGPQKSLF